MIINFTNGAELLHLCNKNSFRIFEIMLEREAHLSERNKDMIIDEMKENLEVMKKAIERGLNEEIRSISGLTGGDAKSSRATMKRKIQRPERI